MKYSDYEKGIFCFDGSADSWRGCSPKENEVCIEGNEDTYNQIWVVNKTSVDHFRCRVLILDDSDQNERIGGGGKSIGGR